MIKLVKRIAILFMILWCSNKSFSQQRDTNNNIYIDYEELRQGIAGKLKAAQKLHNFGSTTQLKKQASTVTLNDKAILTPLKFSKEKLPAEKIFESRKNGVLMICKLYKPYLNNPEKVEVIATAITLSSSGVCASNYHVFKAIIEADAQLHPADSLIFAVTASGNVYPIEKILAYSKNADAAIFKIGADKDSLYPIPLGEPLMVGETVHVIGNPEGFLYYYSQGIVARNTANHKIGLMGNKMEITADYAKGASGGPVLDCRGNLAGMVSSTNSIYVKAGENLQMVVKTTVPVQLIKALIVQN